MAAIVIIFANALVKGSSHTADCQHVFFCRFFFPERHIEKIEDKLEKLQSDKAVAGI
jgi:hypothetical protein